MAPYNEGSFTYKRAMGDLTRDHYLNSHPIEPSFEGIFAHPKKSKVLGPGIEPALPNLKRQRLNQLSYKTTPLIFWVYAKAIRFPRTIAPIIWPMSWLFSIFTERSLLDQKKYVNPFLHVCPDFRTIR